MSTAFGIWRPVTHDVPDADECVLALNTATEAYYLVTWDGESWLDAHTLEIRPVTHWMPLDGPLAPPICP